MASILENLQSIIDSKTSIKTSISNKGVTVPAEAKLNALPALIDSIEQGGGAPEIVDVVFANLVENAESTDIDVVVRIMSNGANATYGVQYRPVGTVNWIEAPTPVVTNNTDVKTLHSFDKIATTTLSELLYQQSWDANLGALRENNNRYEVRAYITGTTNNYVTPRIYTTGWSKYFDNIYEATNDLELGGTKKKRAIAVIHSANLSTTLSQLGGDYYKTSDGYLGVNKNHIFDESQDIPIYLEDGINIKYYIRWVILYTNVATVNIDINDATNKNYLYCYFGNCTPNLVFSTNGNNSSKVEGVRFSPVTNVTSIGYNVFRYCYSLTSINIPNSVTSIGDYAFGSCSSLTSITIPNSVTSIGYNVFYNCYSLASINITNSVTNIGDVVFYGCTSLTSITIPNSVTNIGNDMFYGCTSLTSINIPNSVTSIYHYTFHGCTSLTSINIPNSVTSIGYFAFGSCSSLTSITIPNSVTSIGDFAFQSCSSLTSITFLSIPTTFPTTSIISSTRKVYNVTLPSGWNKTINLVASTTTTDCVLTHRCILDIFNNLASGVTGLTLTLGPTNLARMSVTEKLIATDKGWTLN